MAVEAFLFDLDGTLVDSERLWVAAAEEVLREKGHPVTHDEALALIYGRAWGDIRADLLRDYPGSFEGVEDLEGLMGEAFQRLQGACDIRIASSISLLRRLAGTHPVGIVSGSSRRVVEEMLELAGVADLVACIVSTEDTPRGKPDPAPYLLGAQRLGVRPEGCVVFEDSRAGVLSAKAAGMVAIGLQRDGAPWQDLSQADEVVADLGDLAIERLLGT
ncbi:MAG: HAD family hydrolase [Planctomycetota bacterium]